MIGSTLRSIGLAAVAAAAIALAACSSNGHTRGMFTGKVIGKTEAEIVDTFGPPVSVDRKSPDAPVMHYTQKTFDPDNSNRPDPETLIYLAKDKDGKIVAAEVGFSG